MIEGAQVRSRSLRELEYDFVLNAGGTLEGVVRDEIDLWVLQPARSAPGRIGFTVEAGSYKFVIKSDGFAPTELGPFTLPASGSTLTLDAVLKRTQ